MRYTPTRKPLALANVAADSAALLQDVISDLRRTPLDASHEIYGMVEALIIRFNAIASDSTPTAPPVSVDPIKPVDVQPTPVVEPVKPAAPVRVSTGNDITDSDNYIVEMIGKELRMSTKALKAKGVSAEQILRLEAAGRIEPTAKNRTGWRIKQIQMNLPGDIALHDAHVTAFAANAAKPAVKRNTTKRQETAPQPAQKPSATKVTPGSISESLAVLMRATQSLSLSADRAKAEKAIALLTGLLI